MRNYLLLTAAIAVSAIVTAQQPVPVGSGSYAEYTPLVKSKTDQHGGDKSRIMETRRIYISDSKQGEPIPTNDWWTNLLVDTYSGVLWSYPQVVKADGGGIFVAHPNHWSSDGCEMKYDTRITVKGRRFRPAEAIADDWSDWGLRMQLADGDKRMNVTMAQGVPFTWVEADGLDLLLNLGGGAADLSVDGRIVVTNGSDTYGIYAPEGTAFADNGDGDLRVEFADGKAHYLSIAVLPAADAADFYARYASVVPRNTTVDWRYDERSGMMTSTWSIVTENLDGGAERNVLQGFLPHHYKNSVTDIDFIDYTYATPRGKMRMAAGQRFSTAYKFSGVLPWFAAPKEMPDLGNPYNRERMRQMIADYAQKGAFGADTYWGGKGLTQMALYMTFAREMGEEALFEQCRSRLREALEDWLTYTPGEKSRFFARYDRWGALVGYDTSYDSDTFNDHHFHYGYFTYAGALLALVDDDFRARYGDMLRLVAKDYANWDRSDKRFPWLRTFTPWSGHSYAGGLGNTGNGNGQESTSESMQGWGGVYLLGVALGDKAMRDAGIFGWVTESKGVAEYWFDRNKENIDRTLYSKPYCSNLTAAGIGWWTWFSGDPVWMHSIQWMPVSPCLDYLSEDLKFAKWDYEQMWAAKEIGGWVVNPSEGESTLSKEPGLGNVVLSYLQRFDPDQAARVMDEMWDANALVARQTDTNGISYFITHSHRTYGDRDFAVNADIPTSSAYCNADGRYTYVVYNADAAERVVTFFKDGVKMTQFKAPAHRLTVYGEAPQASSIEIAATVKTVGAGSDTQFSATVRDQYGATVDAAEIAWSTTYGTIDSDGTLHAPSAKGSATITAVCGALSASVDVRVDAVPTLKSVRLLPEMDYAIAGQTVEFSLSAVDQYGDAFPVAHTWAIERDGKVVKSDSILNLKEAGVYTVKAIAGAKTYSHRIFMTPQMPNLAIGAVVIASSEENAGTHKENAVDGDRTTRWSSAASDDQWIAVDLGKEAYVNSVNIVWENAYASLYDVQTSADGKQWTTVKTVAGGGGVEQTIVGASARHIRIACRSRATTYGYSMWELQVLGVDPDADPSALMGISIDAPAIIVKAGAKVALAARGFDGRGNRVALRDVTWSADAGTVAADGVFTPSGYGIATVTASSGGHAATQEFVVEERIAAQTVAIGPKKAEIVKGESVEFSLAAVDQFSVAFPADDFVLTCADAPEMISGRVFTGKRAGTYTVVATDGTVSATATVKVGEFADTNLALGKPVYASSYENSGTVPEYAVDGDASTRWGSDFADNQYLVVDLGAEYVLDRMEIDWNAEAYASSYRVEVSRDEDLWQTVAQEKSSAGGSKTHRFGVAASRYVRVYCMSRHNQYGSCIDELRVYGKARRLNPKPVAITIDAADGMAAFVGTPVRMTASVADQYGVGCADEFGVEWAVDGSCATIDGEGILTPVAEGECVVTAQSGTAVDRCTVRVLSTLVPSALRISPAYMEVEEGAVAEVAVLAADQYGQSVAVDAAEWTVPAGLAVENGKLTANAPGTYMVAAKAFSLKAEAEVKVLPRLTDNIALKKTVTASDGSTVTALNDGNGGSRWIANGETVDLTMDLGGVYHLMRSSILWERAAAADYTVAVSLDGENWQPMSATEGLSDTGADRTDETTVNGIARYVRLSMTRKATQWAYSIYEWQLYGRRMLAGEPCSVAILPHAGETSVGVGVEFEAEVKDCDGNEVTSAPRLWTATGGVFAGGTYSSEIAGTFGIACESMLAKAVSQIEVTCQTSVITTTSVDSCIYLDGGSLVVEADGLTGVTVFAADGRVAMRSDARGDALRCRWALPHGVYVVVVATTSGHRVTKIVL